MLRPGKVTMEAILESFHSMGFVTIEKAKRMPLMEIEKKDPEVIKNSLPKNDSVTYISDHIYVISPN
jgi:hypothetical protein